MRTSIYLMTLLLLTGLGAGCENSGGQSEDPPAYHDQLREHLSKSPEDRIKFSHSKLREVSSAGEFRNIPGARTFEKKDYYELQAPLLHKIRTAGVLTQGATGSCESFAFIGAMGAILHGDSSYFDIGCSLNLGNYLLEASKDKASFDRDYPTLSEVLTKNKFENNTKSQDDMSMDPPIRYYSGWNGSYDAVVLAQIAQFGLVPQSANADCGQVSFDRPTGHDDALSPSVFEANAVPVTDLLEWDFYCGATGESSDTEAWPPCQNPIGAIKDIIDHNGVALIGISLYDNIRSFGIQSSFGYFGEVNHPNVWTRNYGVDVCQWRGTLDSGAPCQLGGHEVYAYGYLDSSKDLSQGLVLVRNSWGNMAGDQGDYYITYDYLMSMTQEITGLHHKVDCVAKPDLLETAHTVGAGDAGGEAGAGGGGEAGAGGAGGEAAGAGGGGEAGAGGAGGEAAGAGAEDTAEIDGGDTPTATVINWSSCNQIGVNHSHSNLSFAILEETNLTGANLSGADLSYGLMLKVNLTGANLQFATLRSANLRSATLIGAAMDGVDLTKTDLRGANLTGANVTDEALSAAKCDENSVLPDGSKGATLGCQPLPTTPTELGCYVYTPDGCPTQGALTGAGVVSTVVKDPNNRLIKALKDAGHSAFDKVGCDGLDLYEYECQAMADSAGVSLLKGDWSWAPSGCLSDLHLQEFLYNTHNPGDNENSNYVSFCISRPSLNDSLGWQRDVQSELRDNAFNDKYACLARQRHFNQLCGIEDAAMVHVAGLVFTAEGQYPHFRSQKTVKVDDTFRIHLTGNGTTGYEWKINEDTVDSTVLDCDAGHYYPELSGPTYRGQQRTGGGGMFVITCTALKTGKNTITANQYRNWMGIQPDDTSYTVELEVIPK
jgi:predicted secreted protein